MDEIKAATLKDVTGLRDSLKKSYIELFRDVGINPDFWIDELSREANERGLHDLHLNALTSAIEECDPIDIAKWLLAGK